MGVNSKLADITAAVPAGGDLIYIEKGGNSRRAILGSVGAQLLSDTGTTTALATLGLTVGAAGLDILADATVDNVYTSLSTAVWTSGTTRTMKERSKFACHIADFAAPSTTVDRTTEILAWADQGQDAGVKLVLGSDSSDYADYITEEEIEITRPGQVIEWENAGGYAYGEDIGANWSLDANRNTRLRAAGGVGAWFNTTGKRVRTRRLFRGSVSDPQDTGLSAVLNIQAEGVQIIRPHIWLDCDYSNASPSNLGDYCDVGIFAGTRVGLQIHDPQIIGYFRRAGIYIDVSGHTSLDRTLDKTGVAYPAGTVKNGADGTHLFNPYIRGARQGLAILGARPKVGQTDYSDAYYDQQLGATVADARGSFGCSDFLVIGGRIYGPDHHSNRRLADPTLDGGVLNQTSLEAESDTMPAALYIDGLAGNSSTNLWGMRFVGTRIATFEAFRARLRKASRVDFFGCHIEGRGGGRFDTAGNSIDTNDYTTISYGDISGESITDRTTAFDTVRQSYADGLAPHYYGTDGKPFYVTASGRVGVPAYLLNEEDELDLRGGIGTGVRFRSGTTTIGTVSTNGVASFTGGVVMAGYTAAQIADATHAVNTTGKTTNQTIKDTTNNRLMVARGSAATSAWDVADGSASVTPA